MKKILVAIFALLLPFQASALGGNAVIIGPTVSGDCIESDGSILLKDAGVACGGPSNGATYDSPSVATAIPYFANTTGLLDSTLIDYGQDNNSNPQLTPSTGTLSLNGGLSFVNTTTSWTIGGGDSLPFTILDEFADEVVFQIDSFLTGSTGQITAKGSQVLNDGNGSMYVNSITAYGYINAGSFFTDNLSGQNDNAQYLAYGDMAGNGQLVLGDVARNYGGITLTIDQSTQISTSGQLGVGVYSPLYALDVFDTNSTGVDAGNSSSGLWAISSAGVAGFASFVKTGGTSSQFLKADGSVDSTAYGTGTVTSITAGTGLTGGAITTSGTITSNAVYQIAFQPGALSAVTSTIGVYGKVSKASTVDNIVGSALLFTCVGNPTVTMYECGTSTTCTSPTTIGSVTVTSSGTAVTGTVSNPAITAGHYVGWSISAGTCTSLDISATAQIHSN